MVEAAANITVNYVNDLEVTIPYGKATTVKFVFDKEYEHIANLTISYTDVFYSADNTNYGLLTFTPKDRDAGTRGKINWRVTSPDGNLVLPVYVNVEERVFVQPSITSGANSVYQIKDGKDLVFNCTGKLEELVNIYVDGVLLDASHYTLQSGSTILSLKSSYLDTLVIGNYNLEFNYEGEKSAETSFMITAQKKEIPKDNETPKNNEAPKKNETNQKVNAPNTGDETNVIGLVSLLGVSLLVVAFTLNKKIKRVK